jgi:hypothetical protein
MAATRVQTAATETLTSVATRCKVPLFMSGRSVPDEQSVIEAIQVTHLPATDPGRPAPCQPKKQSRYYAEEYLTCRTESHFDAEMAIDSLLERSC